MDKPIRGRAAATNPANRFEPIHFEPDPDEDPGEGEESLRGPRTAFYRDASRSILARNDSPDVPFNYSINPYRGCEHGCIYCYARPSHEFLGFSAGLDFETRILVKEDAPRLLAEALAAPRWRPQVVCLSGNTDCYQPIDRRLRLTRQCLEVFLRFRNPVAVITKNRLITRDADLIQELASRELAIATLSITTLRPELARVMEPRTSSPQDRLHAVAELAAAGIPVNVNIAPVIPGLNDSEIPAIIEEAAARGARTARYLMLRLPGAVEPLFVEWVRRVLPDRAERILNRQRELHGGELHDARFGTRMRGEGQLAEVLRRLFQQSCARHGLNEQDFQLTTEHFRRPGGQRELF